MFSSAVIILGLLRSVSTSYEMFAFLDFCNAFLDSGIYSSAFVLGTKNAYLTNFWHGFKGKVHKGKVIEQCALHVLTRSGYLPLVPISYVYLDLVKFGVPPERDDRSYSNYFWRRLLTKPHNKTKFTRITFEKFSFLFFF